MQRHRLEANDALEAGKAQLVRRTLRCLLRVGNVRHAQCTDCANRTVDWISIAVTRPVRPTALI